MRFHLYRCDIRRADRKVMAFVVAPDEQRASEIIVSAEIEFNLENEGFELERVDDGLPPRYQKGLDALLEKAPVGLASFCDALGWVPHALPSPRLHLWRIEEVGGDDQFALAPTGDLASAVYATTLQMRKHEPRMVRIHDGMIGLSNEALKGLPALIEYGDISLVEWDDEKGWVMIAT